MNKCVVTWRFDTFRRLSAQRIIATEAESLKPFVSQAALGQACPAGERARSVQRIILEICFFGVYVNIYVCIIWRESAFLDGFRDSDEMCSWVKKMKYCFRVLTYNIFVSTKVFLLYRLSGYRPISQDKNN